MNKIGLLSALLAIAVILPADANAKGRVRSSHSHSDSHPHQTAESHASEGGGSYVRSAVTRSDRSTENGSANSGMPAAGNTVATEEDANLRRLRQEKEAARAKRDAETLAARKLQQESDAEKRRLQAEQAAINATDEQKRKDAEARTKNRELAQLERQKRQVAWESRCQIKAVMSDEEIATCKKVWSTPAP